MMAAGEPASLICRAVSSIPDSVVTIC